MGSHQHFLKFFNQHIFALVLLLGFGLSIDLFAAPIEPTLSTYRVKFTEVAERNIPQEQALFTALDGETLFFEPDLGDAYWVKLELPNDDEIRRGHLITINPTTLHNVDIYIPEISPDLPVSSLSRFRITSAPKFSRQSSVFEIPDNYKTGQEIFLYVHSRTDEHLQVQYWEHDEFLVKDRKQSTLSSATLASLFILIMVNIIFFVAIRDRDYLAYVCYLSAFLLFIMMSSGKIYEFQSGKWLAGSYNSTLFLYSLTCICFTVFMQTFLKLKTYTPVFYQFTRLCILIYSSIALLALILWPVPHICFNVVNYLALLSLPFLLLACFKTWIKGNKHSAYFVVAFAPLLVMLLIRLLVILSYIPDWEFALNGFQFAVVFQAIILTIGLSDHILDLRKERDAALNYSSEIQTNLQQQQEFADLLSSVSAMVRANPTGDHEHLIVNTFFNHIKRYLNIDYAAIIYQLDTELKLHANNTAVKTGFEDYVSDHITDITKICNGKEVKELPVFDHALFPKQSKMIILPIHMRGHEWSGFMLNTAVTNTLSNEDHDVLEHYATDLIRALINAQKLRHFSHKAETDDLTQVMNRGAIMNQLNKEVDNSIISSLPLSIAFMDIDHFKLINDKLGHEAGDTCLSYLAYQIKRYIPKDVYVGRMGGDEFLFIFPNYLPVIAKDVLARLSGSLDTLIIEDDECMFTLSIGIARFKGDEMDFKSFLRKADEALYQAKENGRDQICIAEIALKPKPHENKES